jgi:signal transduction histidine kinase/DNA-binding response OmpR family regulator/HAMP domain-containing protein
MGFLNNLPLNKKLLLSFLVIMVLSVISMGMSLNSLNIINSRFNLIVDKNVVLLVNSLKIRRGIFEMRMYEKEMFLTVNDSEKVNFFFIRKIQKEIQTRFNNIRQLDLTSEEMIALDLFKEQYQQYEVSLNKIVGLVENGQIKEALELSHSDTNSLGQKVIAGALSLANDQEKALQIADEETDVITANQMKLSLVSMVFIFMLSMLIAWLISKSLVSRITQLIKITHRISSGDLQTKNMVAGDDEIGQLAVSINLMQENLRSGLVNIEKQNWLKAGIARINKVLLGQDDVNTLGSKTITEIADYIGAGVGALYGVKELDNGSVLTLIGTYAYTQHKELPTQYNFGEGLIGQVALTYKQILLKDAPDNYIKIVSGIGETSPKNICIVPVLFENTLQGVLELGTFEALSPLQLEYLEQATEVVATAFEIAIAQDRMKRQQEALKQANEKLTELDQMKTNFLSTVSHELRTPLTSVIGFARIMQKKFDSVLYPALAESEDKKVQKAIRQVMDNTAIIVEEGQRLTTLINDVLDLAKMEAGRVDWNITELYIEDIIDRGIASTSSLFAHKPVKLSKDIAPNLPLCQGDRDRLIQVVINLISNAIKFTDKGAVTLKAAIKGHELVVSVIDSGSGIKPEDQPLVFEKFKQVGDTMTDKPQGTGLGLPICKEIIEHLGGRLWVESEMGVGSSFMFSLPLSEHGAAKIIYTRQDSIENKSTVTTKDGDEISFVWHSDSLALENALNLSLEQALIPVTSSVPNILIIDDNINIRQFLHQELSAHDYEVHEASSGAEGLAMITAHKPDLIILDVKMPHLNGFEVAVRLHTNPVTLYIPVIFHTIAEDQLLGEKLGIDCYLTKPVRDLDLLDAVNKLLKTPRLRKKILLFMANPDKRKKWVNLLERCSFEVAAVENVLEGIESAVAFNPHLVIAEASLAKDFKIIHQLRVDRGLDRILFTLLEDA